MTSSRSRSAAAAAAVFACSPVARSLESASPHPRARRRRPPRWRTPPASATNRLRPPPCPRRRGRAPAQGLWCVPRGHVRQHQTAAAASDDGEQERGHVLSSEKQKIVKKKDRLMHRDPCDLYHFCTLPRDPCSLICAPRAISRVHHVGIVALITMSYSLEEQHKS